MEEEEAAADGFCILVLTKGQPLADNCTPSRVRLCHFPEPYLSKAWSIPWM